jgi:hypothetical protein
MSKIAFASTLAAVTLLLAQSSSSYRITHTYPLGGDGSWDYIVPDPLHHRLFIARQNRVMVVDQDKGTLLGEVTGIQGAHGTALAEAAGHGFATSGNDHSVVMFDLKTFKSLGRIPAAEDADAILYDPASNRVFTLNGDAHSSTVIDPRAGTLITNIHGNPPGRAGPISRRRNRTDAGGVAQHGTRFQQSSGLPRLGEVWAAARRQGPRTGAPGFICSSRDRARSGRALILYVHSSGPPIARLGAGLRIPNSARQNHLGPFPRGDRRLE